MRLDIVACAVSQMLEEGTGARERQATKKDTRTRLEMKEASVLDGHYVIYVHAMFPHGGMEHLRRYYQS